MIDRTFSFGFTHGTAECLTTIEGEHCDKLSRAIDEVNGVVSKRISRFLVPMLNKGVRMLSIKSGSTEYRKTVKGDLLGHFLTLDIKLDLGLQLEDREERLLDVIMTSIVLPEIIAVAAARIAEHLHDEGVDVDLSSPILFPLSSDADASVFGGLLDFPPVDDALAEMLTSMPSGPERMN